jgi:hypothetical protein
MGWTMMLKLKGNKLEKTRNRQTWQNILRKAVAPKRADLPMMMTFITSLNRRSLSSDCTF